MRFWSVLALASNPDIFCLSQENTEFYLLFPNNVMHVFKHLVFLLGSDEGYLSSAHRQSGLVSQDSGREGPTTGIVLVSYWDPSDN